MKKAPTQSHDLAAIRQQKGISLVDIAAVTKIGVRYLEAIECGEFARLPGGIYGTSYIRQYARAVAVPEADLLARYLQLSR
jgi:cytoskeleton protein RodZ